MKTQFIISVALGAIIICLAVCFSSVFAQTTVRTSDIQYPVKELSDCQNEAACRLYCDKPENMNACLNFAEQHNLMSQKEIKAAKNFMAAGNEGPGGCVGKNSCEAYCNNISHIDECISFAEKNNLIPAEELAEAKKVQAAIKRGVKPPACGNKKDCDVYCEAPEHMEECISFGIEAGFIQGKELEDAQKMLTAVKKGVKPPPCRGKEACDEYCSQPENMEKCMTFAIEAGFMSEQEKADSQKMFAAFKKGAKPPACRGKKECDIYCAQEEHFEECIKFAEAAGFMSAEDAAMARKTGGKGPGDCKGKEECEIFCNNPKNQEVCFNFAKEHGLISKEELKKMEENRQRFVESLKQAPSEVQRCLDSLIGVERMAGFRNGAVMPPQEVGEQMRSCFEKMMSSEGMTPSRQIISDECENFEECKKFQPAPGAVNPGGQIMPPQAGPGGCKGPEECRVYCSDPAHKKECENFKVMPPGEIKPPTEGECCRCCPPEVEICIQACCPCFQEGGTTTQPIMKPSTEGQMPIPYGETIQPTQPKQQPIEQQMQFMPSGGIMTSPPPVTSTSGAQTNIPVSELSPTIYRVFSEFIKSFNK